jgi:hypothetical protein
MISVSPRRIVALVSLAAVVVCFWAGCQPVGPTAEYRRDVTSIASPSTTLNLTDRSGAWTFTGAGSAGNTTLTTYLPDGLLQTELSSIWGGVASREVIIPVGEGKHAVIRSGSDVMIRVDRLAQGPMGLELAGLEVSSNTSEPTRAGNEAYDRLVGYFSALSAEQRAVAVEQVRAAVSISGDLRGLLASFVEAAARAISPIP